MAKIEWDRTGERLYETGVDHCVLYIPTSGVYGDGVAWNGITSINETPSGAEANAVYADNIKYLNLMSAEEFGGTIEAFTYPDEFLQFDGGVLLNGGIILGQQSRPQFGLSYRTKIGNDTDGEAYGYKLHLVYGAQASPSERTYATINDSPEAATLSWEFSTTPVSVQGHKPTAILTIDSTKVDATELSALEVVLYGSASDSARLPTPDEVLEMFPNSGSGTSTVVVSPVAPTYNSTTHVVDISEWPTTGVDYFTNDIPWDGVQETITLSFGETLNVTAAPAQGYVFAGGTTAEWDFSY